MSFGKNEVSMLVSRDWFYKKYVSIALTRVGFDGCDKN